MQRIPVVTSLAFALLCTSAPTEAKEASLDPHLQPLAFLVGHCWRASFPNGTRDLQCFESLYNGKLVANSHQVQGTDPLYQGQTIFSWDAANQRIRFHYFTSTGAVSEGHFQQDEDGIRIPARHVGKEGKVTELENHYKPDVAFAYRVMPREKTSAGWLERMNLHYLRTDAPQSAPNTVALTPEGGTWQLVWSSNRDANWEIYSQQHHLDAQVPGARLRRVGDGCRRLERREPDRGAYWQ